MLSLLGRHDVFKDSGTEVAVTDRISVGWMSCFKCLMSEDYRFVPGMRKKKATWKYGRKSRRISDDYQLQRWECFRLMTGYEMKDRKRNEDIREVLGLDGIKDCLLYERLRSCELRGTCKKSNEPEHRRRKGERKSSEVTVKNNSPKIWIKDEA